MPAWRGGREVRGDVNASPATPRYSETLLRVPDSSLSRGLWKPHLRPPCCRTRKLRREQGQPCPNCGVKASGKSGRAPLYPCRVLSYVPGAVLGVGAPTSWPEGARAVGVGAGACQEPLGALAQSSLRSDGRSGPGEGTELFPAAQCGDRSPREC